MVSCSDRRSKHFASLLLGCVSEMGQYPSCAYIYILNIDINSYFGLQQKPKLEPALWRRL